MQLSQDLKVQIYEGQMGMQGEHARSHWAGGQCKEHYFSWRIQHPHNGPVANPCVFDPFRYNKSISAIREHLQQPASLSFVLLISRNFQTFNRNPQTVNIVPGAPSLVRMLQDTSSSAWATWLHQIIVVESAYYTLGSCRPRGLRPQQLYQASFLHAQTLPVCGQSA